MIKYILFIILFSPLLFTKTIDCIVPQNIVKKIKPLFKKMVPYSKLQINIQTSLDDKEALTHLVHYKKAKFSIIRRDILWQLQQTNNTLKDAYILISELPFSSILYLVQNKDSFNIDLNSLVKKRVSIGSLGELSKFYLKTLLNERTIQYKVLYKSLVYEKSIQQIQAGKIDAYFGFLLPRKESNNLHFQALFSEQTVKYFKNKNIFNIDYNGIASPYILVASITANDEEIENVIYRLMEKKLFVPITDDRFGTINRYVLTHLEQVEKYLKYHYKSPINEQINFRKKENKCRKYHYGFLKLLRQKPTWKKNLKRLKSMKKRKNLLKAFNSILLKIDREKHTCDLKFLKTQKIKLDQLKKIF